MTIATIKMICPNLACKTILSVPVKARGKTVRCRACGTRIGVPVAPRPETPAAPSPVGDGEGGETVG